LRSRVLVLIAMLGAATAHADPDVPPAGAPPDMTVFACRADEGDKRSCLECTPDTTGTQFCQRCSRRTDGTPLTCAFPDAADLQVLTDNKVAASRSVMTTWRPKPAIQTYACSGDSCIECEPDGTGGTFCERCRRNSAGLPVGLCTLSDADRQELTKLGVVPSAHRQWPRWDPWEPQRVSILPPALATGKLPGITEYRCDFLAPYNQRVCQECTADRDGGTACRRVLRDANMQPVNSWSLEASEVAELERRGIKVSNPPPVTAPPPPPPGGGVVVAPNEPSKPKPPAVPWKHRRRGVSFGIEVGRIGPADGNNIYGPGYGRGYVFGYSIFEVRIEGYDLPDRTNTYGNVQGANGRLNIGSFAVRPVVLTLGPIELTALLGLAAILRPWLGMDETTISSGVERNTQYGGGAVVGGGARLYDVITIDVRAYPSTWMGSPGSRAEVGPTGMLTYVPFTDTPGGMPITFNAGVGVAF
jgi:hypothetical protein